MGGIIDTPHNNRNDWLPLVVQHRGTGYSAPKPALSAGFAALID